LISKGVDHKRRTPARVMVLRLLNAQGMFKFFKRIYSFRAVLSSR